MNAELPFEIVAPCGDWAGADSFENAKCAAETLVEDGNPSADVYRWKLGGWSWVGAAMRRDDGAIAFVSSQGSARTLG
jgi:hypothetical protein